MYNYNIIIGEINIILTHEDKFTKQELTYIVQKIIDGLVEEVFDVKKACEYRISDLIKNNALENKLLEFGFEKINVAETLFIDDTEIFAKSSKYFSKIYEHVDLPGCRKCDKHVQECRVPNRRYEVEYDYNGDIIHSKKEKRKIIEDYNDILLEKYWLEEKERDKRRKKIKPFRTTSFM